MTKNLKILLIVLGVIVVGGLVTLAFQTPGPVEEAVETEEPEVDELVADEEEKEIEVDEVDEPEVDKTFVDEEKKTMNEAEEILMSFLEHVFKDSNYSEAIDLYHSEVGLEDEEVEESLERQVGSFGLGIEEHTYIDYTGEEAIRPATPSVDEIEILSREKATKKNIYFSVQFILTDGSFLKVTICCDPETQDYIVNKKHRFTVEKIDGEWMVTNMIYQP